MVSISMFQGDDGEAGEEGEPGADAEYCPCPSRSASAAVMSAYARRRKLF